jgi:TonB family protein
LLRPLILIPNEAKFWDSDRRRAILLHELAHIRRHDLWANAVAAVATALFWFHPLVWMLARRMRAEQELACDDVVLNEGIVPTSYAELLLDSASGFRSTALFGCAMAGSGAFKYRLVHVLDRARLRATTRTALVSAGLALLAAVVALGLMQPAMAQGVHEIGGKVKPPELIQKVEPSYTEEAKDAKIQGRVVVRVIVGTDGKIREPRIVTSLDPGLDANAIEALEQWLFKPATREGEPVAVRAQVEMNFRLF